MSEPRSVVFNIMQCDPYFRFPLSGNKKKDESALEVYRILYQKRYKCLTQYTGSKVMMTVVCPNDHIWGGYPKKIAIPCNNCQTCWDNRNLTPAQKFV